VKLSGWRIQARRLDALATQQARHTFGYILRIAQVVQLDEQLLLPDRFSIRRNILAGT
jgi:hypothetical protein